MTEPQAVNPLSVQHRVMAFRNYRLLEWTDLSRKARRNNVVGEAFSAGLWYPVPSGMFEEFSTAYYLGRLYVEPGTHENTFMCQDQHDALRDQLYDGRRDDPAARPLVVKLGSRHLAVYGEQGVPADTLSVPHDILSETTLTNPPTLTEVLLAKAERAAQLFRLTNTARDPHGSTDSTGI